MIVAVFLALSATYAAASPITCSSVLPLSAPECRISAISGSLSRQLESQFNRNLSVTHHSMTDIINKTTCHPEYLRLNAVSYESS